MVARSVRSRALARLQRALAVAGNAILMYHAVGGRGYDRIPPTRLRRDLERLTVSYEVVDLPEAASTAADDRRRVALTFDDGYADFDEHVRPLLHEFDVPATVFVVADTLDDPAFAHDERGGRYLSEAQLLELVEDDLVTIGNHTASHPRLSGVDEGDLRREVLGARETLESRLGATIDRFSYPFGDHDERARELVRRTHRYGVTVDHGTVPASPAVERLPRIDGARPLPLLRTDLGSLAGRLPGDVTG